MMQTTSADYSQKPTKRANQDDLIYEQMFSAILEQKLTPGTKLSEDVLGEIFGVSRTIIRKVLQRLAYEKVVCIRPNRGAFVAEPTPDEAKDVFEARRVVETGIIRNVVQRHNPAHVQELETMLTAEAASIAKGAHSQWVALSGDFHMVLARISGNRSLEEFLKELVSRTSLIHVQYQSNKIGPQTCSCDEHADIIEAIRAQDEEKAVELMLAHLNGIEKGLNLDGTDPVSDLYEIFGGKPQSGF